MLSSIAFSTIFFAFARRLQYDFILLFIQYIVPYYIMYSNE